MSDEASLMAVIIFSPSSPRAKKWLSVTVRQSFNKFICNGYARMVLSQRFCNGCSGKYAYPECGEIADFATRWTSRRPLCINAGFLFGTSALKRYPRRRRSQRCAVVVCQQKSKPRASSPREVVTRRGKDKTKNKCRIRGYK